MAKRRHFGKEFKARVALEAIKGIKTINQIAGEFEVHANRYWEKHFKKQDANKDGLLKPDEYKPSVLFNHVDADDGGTITLEEYQAIYAVHFKKRDVNSDGKLDENEIWKVK